MYSKQNLFVALIAFLGISMAIAGESNYRANEENGLNFLSFMSRSSSVLQRDPSRSMECFNYYIPLINEIGETYKTNYNACLKTSDDSRAETEAATLEARNDLVNRASTSCELLSKCNNIESAEDVFECFVNGGSVNSKAMYNINADASQELSDLQDKLRLIETVKFKCTNETKRAYEKDSSTAYNNLNSCVLGVTEVPKPTSAPATTPAATDAPAPAKRHASKSRLRY